MGYDAIGIGWDVGGWQGKKQATAAVAWSKGMEKLSWLGISPTFPLSRRTPISLETLLAPAKVDYAALQGSESVSIAIDAPLAYPLRFLRLLQGQAPLNSAPQSELENPLAYRDCERWIKKRFGKKPLSPVFDKLGNNATVALSAVCTLEQQGFTCVPQKASRSSRAIIEAYPALLKQKGTTAAPVHQALERFVPTEVNPGTDSYDAALAALIALAYCTEGESTGLPDLIHPLPGFPREEGWIYGFNLAKLN